MFRIRLASQHINPVSLWLTLLIVCTGSKPGNAQYGNANQVGSPVFHLNDGSQRHGAKCFAIKWFRSRSLLLCPLHSIEPDPSDRSLSFIKPGSLPDVITSVEVMDLPLKEVIASGTHGLLRKSSVGRTWNLCDDLAAFELTDTSKLAVLGLSGQLPAPGTRVWVLSKTYPAQTSEVERFPGTVTEAAPTGINIKLLQPLKALGSSGAPIVNERNEVVGMLVGTDATRTIVTAAPSTGLYRRLYTEVGQ